SGRSQFARAACSARNARNFASRRSRGLSAPSKPGFEGFEGRDECHWCKIPGLPVASSAAMRAPTSAKVALGGGLEVERSNRAPCFARDLAEQLKVHPASPGSTRAHRLGRRGQFGGLAHLDQL